VSDIQDIETLKRRFESLREKKTRAETLLGTAEGELRRLQAEATERYGTSDVESLKAKLKQIEEDNRRKQRDYQTQLDGIDAKLKQVEETFRNE
jgi:hypothetical protein